jgi:signal transduction histidine kinase
MNSFLHTWSFKMTALFAVLFLFFPAVLFAVVYWLAQDYAAEDYREELITEFNIIMNDAKEDGYRSLPAIVEKHLRLHAQRPTVYLLEDASGNKLVGNLDAIPPKAGPLKVAFPERRIDGMLEAYMFMTPNGDYLLIGEVSEKLDFMEDAIIATFVAGGALSVAIGVLFGLLASRVLLARLRTVGAAARSIAAGNMLARVPTRGRGDEFDDLGRSINLMLERIEELMRRVRQISSDIAHDLRAPLSVLKRNIEDAKSGAHPPARLNDVLDQASEQVDSILSTFDSLLKIGQIEAAHVSAAASVDLSAAIAIVVEDFMPAAQDQGRVLAGDIEPGIVIVGEERLVVQLTINLIENAIRHTPPGTEIHVGVKRTPMGAVLEVADNGPGLPSAEFQKIARPFYRLPSSAGVAGNGLGLSLVAAIADYHGAALAFADNGPGLRVSVTFPAS